VIQLGFAVGFTEASPLHFNNDSSAQVQFYDHGGHAMIATTVTIMVRLRVIIIMGGRIDMQFIMNATSPQ